MNRAACLSLHRDGLPLKVLQAINDRTDVDRKELSELVGPQAADTLRHAILKLKALGLVQETITLTYEGFELLDRIRKIDGGEACFVRHPRWGAVGDVDPHRTYEVATTDDQIRLVRLQAAAAAREVSLPEHPYHEGSNA